MRKFWKIFQHEYSRHVLRKRFLLALASVPLWILFSIGMGLLSVVISTNRAPVGVVDEAGFFGQSDLSASNQLNSSMIPIEFQPFGSRTAAQNALRAKTIQAYFVLPTDYRESLHVQLFYLEQPSSTIYSQFRNLLRAQFLSGQPADVTRRVLSDPDLIVQTTIQNEQTSTENWLKVAAPIVVAIFLIVSVFSSSGYLMQAVIEEKENRTMEILVTSVSPNTIMAAKTTALICVGLTQVLVWSILPLVGILLAITYTPFMNGLSVDIGSLALAFLTAIPTFFLIASLMTAIGATVTEANEGQQVSSLVTLPVMIPFMLMSLFVSHPDSPVTVFLSFFPLTASLALLLRMAFSTVPAWQVILSTAILLLTAAGALWLAGRVFRLGMLRYGKRMTLQEVFQALMPDRRGEHSAAEPAERTRQA
jgi:ABC-2 type transport system permease protein